MPRRGDSQQTTNALVAKALEDLKNQMSEGFRGMHERQDTTNGKVLKGADDVAVLKTELAVLKTQNKNSKIIWYLFTSALGVALVFATYLITN